MSPPDEAEIEKLTFLLDSKKSNNLHRVSVDLFKYLAKYAYPVLSELFNESMSTGVFLDHMKLVTVTTVYKGGSKLDISNYQPISVLSILNKVLEKIVQFR